jgi:predicted ATPase with chaperone activity
VLKVARTIADLAGAAQIDTAQISEAMSLRKLDRSDLP